jgi:Flp pilus assembly protein TadB
MSFNLYLAFAILGCDFLLYAFFQWVYGEKHRKHARRVAARQEKRRAVSEKESSDARGLSFPQRAMHYRTGSL